MAYTLPNTWRAYLSAPRFADVQAGAFYFPVIQCVVCLCAEMSDLRQNKVGEMLDRLNKRVYLCFIK